MIVLVPVPMEINTGSTKVTAAERFRERTSAFIISLNEWLKEECQRKLVPCVDLYSAFASPDRQDLLDPRVALGDNAHLNLDGHRRLADTFLREYFSVDTDFSVVVCLGDSHTQGYPLRELDRNGLPVDPELDSPNQYPFWMAKAAKRTFINRGIAGNTYFGMTKRFDMEVLPHYPDHCIIQGGNNDALLGTPLEDTKSDIIWLIERCIENDITPVASTTVQLGF
jgi:lysophospholipase L1-like esterase